MVKPVNGQNPVVQQAAKIRLGMPGDEELDEEQEGEWWEEDPGDEPLSADEAEAAPRQRRRRPRMPAVPRPARDGAWKPPWPVDEDGNAVGVPMAAEGSPPGEEAPEGFDPPRGTTELALKMMTPR
jgi:hypothetical protein